jgi:hypothetical protein
MNGMFRFRGLVAFALVATVLAPLGARGQGGPPMITDDPGTPGNGKWEINIPIAFEHRPNEWSLDAPGLDLNYGLGEHLQLTLQTAAALLKQSDHGLVGGLGGVEAAVKWRFIDEEQSGFAVSTFPRLLFNVVQSSVRRGLADDGTRFQLPVEFAKTIGVFGIGAEFGPLISSVSRSEWLYGLIGGMNVSKTTELMAELHGNSRTNFTADTLVVNVGFRHELSEHCIWIASLGHEVRTPDDDPFALVGYCGVQLLY